MWPLNFWCCKIGENLHPNNSTIVLKNEDNISLFLIQTFSKFGGGKPFTQIQEVYKKALTHMQESSLAKACVYAAALGQFLMAPVNSIDVDDGRALGSTFPRNRRRSLYIVPNFFWHGHVKKMRTVHRQNKSSSIGHFKKSN